MMRYILWALFVGSVFFAISAHTYYLFVGREAVGAAIYGGLVGLTFAFATVKNVPFRFAVRLLAGLVYIVLSAVSYQWIFAPEIGYYSSRRELLATGAALAVVPAGIWLLRRASRPDEARYKEVSE